MTIVSSDKNINAKVLFFGRELCPGTKKALNLLNSLEFDVTLITSKSRGEAIPEEAFEWQGDYIFCFRSLFFLPESILYVTIKSFLLNNCVNASSTFTL